MPLNTPNNLPAPVQQSFNQKLLLTEQPNLIHKIPATRYTMPRNGGTTVKFRRPERLSPALAPLGPDGVTPPSQLLQFTDIEAKMSFYGSWIAVTDQVTLQNQDPTLNWAAERLGCCLRETEDILTRDMLAATATLLDCVGGANGDNPTNLTRSDVNEANRLLLGNNARYLLDNIQGENRFGTGPTRASYLALCHTDMTGDLDAINGFIHNSQYPDQRKILPSEWGACGNMRFFVSSLGSIVPAASNLGADIYQIFITGMDGYACIEQDGYSAAFIYNPPQIAGGPLGLYATAGFKFAEVSRITHETWVLRMRATLS